MQLFSVSNDALTSVEKAPFALEKDIQVLVEKNLETLFSLQFVSTEFSIANFRLDTLAFDEQANAFVIIEYKKGSSYSVIDQGYSYLSTMLNNKADFILEYNEQTGTTLKRDEVDWSASRVIFVSPSFNAYQKNSVNFRDVPFELWEIKRFANDLVVFEQHQSSSNESINHLSNESGNSVIQQVSKEVKQVTEEELLSSVPQDLRNLWTQLREKLSAYPDTNFYTTKGYVGWKKDSTGISFNRIQKNQITAEILRGSKTSSGESSKGFFTLDDPKNLAQDRTWHWKSGKTGHSYVVKICDASDLDYALYLLNQKYESL